MQLSRRHFHSRLVQATAGYALAQMPLRSTADETGPLETFVPTRAITRGPANHWFGYYDKRELIQPADSYSVARRISRRMEVRYASAL